MKIDFVHRQSAHCESGVTANLLHHYGIDISEAMAFGIGAGLFFGYLPFIKVNRLPLTTFRCEVGGIFKRLTRWFGLQVRWQKFRDPEKAMDALDRKIDEGVPVGCRTGGYWLPYFPPAFRFHFNMHNLVVIGREDDHYIISDPVFPDLERCHRKDLMKARFAKGAMAPRGTMYYLTRVPETVPISGSIQNGIRIVCRRMLHTPGPLIGVKGIRYLARQVTKWPDKLGERKASLYVTQLIRMQEELGTGGGGFRFMYAAFLQEAAQQLQAPVLQDLSYKMTEVGDLWREFAVIGARNCKGRAGINDSYASMTRILMECANREEDIYRKLLPAIRQKSSARQAVA
jgi:hypothetical protein